MSFGALTFAAPWALAALAALPLLFWLLRAAPPPPTRAEFPPTRLLLDLKTEQQSRERAPWWLLLLRALAASLLILGFARPSLTPPTEAAAGGGRTLIVIDDGWTSAPFWSEARSAALNAIAEAERGQGAVHMLMTAPQAIPRNPGEALTPADARGRVSRLEPKPWRPDRADATARLEQINGQFDRIVWISDGLEDAGADEFAAALQARGPVVARLPERTALAVVEAAATQNGVEFSVRRAAGGPPLAVAAAETIEGRSLGAGEARFEGGALTASAQIELPPEIAARAARVRLVGEAGAGGVRLLAGGAARPFVGLIDPGGAGQPLVSELFYAERALAPYASLQRGDVDVLLDARVQAMILPDAVALTPRERDALGDWVEGGGLLVRFAGPRLADDADELLPVRLRPGSRTIGGALAWENPLRIAPFPSDSPFAGIAPPDDVLVHRQVLAEPASLEEARVWARLEDNSPLTSAQARGDGLIVLFHISAGPSWSDLPLSGAYVELLRRTLAFAGRADGAGARDIAAGPYAPVHLLDGYGALSAAPGDAVSIPGEQFNLAVPGPHAPPGLYERAGVSAAIDAARADESMSVFELPSGIERARLDMAALVPLAGWFLGAAAAMIALDLLVALYLIGRLPRWSKRAAALVLALMVLAPQAQAQSLYERGPFAPQSTRASTSDPTLALRLAYVRTGDARIDRTSEDGLEALSAMLGARTSVEPGAPIGVDLARDDLSPYPFLYWPAPSSPQPLSDEALENVERYLAVGGLLLVDTRDAGASSSARPAAAMLRGLDAPPLEEVTSEHVVARAFYLMRSFPGRAQTTRLWAETGEAAQARDGVAALFIGDGDWAAAWAGGSQLAGRGRQRELSLRFGVNLVMVALTGNYKADQVHLPALLERLGRERR